MTPSDDEPTRPITPATFHILLTLADEGVGHGYHVKRVVEERTNGAVRLGAGTLYAGLQRMAKDGLIGETAAPADALDVEPGSRWRFYVITPLGRDVLRSEVMRLEADLEAARAVMHRLA